MLKIKLIAIFISAYLVVSVGSASGLTCIFLFQKEITTATHIQNISEENFKNKIKTTGYERVNHNLDRYGDDL